MWDSRVGNANAADLVHAMPKTLMIDLVMYVQNIFQPSFVGSFDVV